MSPTVPAFSPYRTPYTLSEPAFTALLARCEDFSKTYMSRFDPSHDFLHIQRVRALALRLAAASPIPLDIRLITLSALLHDVGDHKYTDASESLTPIKDKLLTFSCPLELASAVQTVASHVSFSNESKNPESVARVLVVFPELAVVQDADRLDAIGAVGIARCFVYGGVKMPKRGLEGGVEHFDEKLVHLEGMMKTDLGREIAVVRTERIKEFRRWWKEEAEE